MNFNTNNEWKSYVTEVMICGIVFIVYIATFGLSLKV